jgi:histidine phosphotransferase ChpT
MCVETALPLGGDIEVSNTDGTWAIFAKHDGLKLDPALWVPLSKGFECFMILHYITIKQ